MYTMFLFLGISAFKYAPPMSAVPTSLPSFAAMAISVITLCCSMIGLSLPALVMAWWGIKNGLRYRPLPVDRQLCWGRSRVSLSIPLSDIETKAFNR